MSEAILSNKAPGSLTHFPHAYMYIAPNERDAAILSILSINRPFWQIVL